MAFANGSGTRIAFVPETVFGQTPATPTFQIGRFTGAGLRTNKTTGTSDEMRQDRNVPAEFQLGQDVAGNYDLEFSYGAFDALLEGALFGAWSSNVLVNGIIPKSFTFEETLELGVTDSFSRYTGVMVNTLSLEIASRAAITGTIGLMGQKEELAQAIVTGATYAAATTEPVLTASAHVAALTVAGQNYAVRRVQMELSNNLRTRPLVGDLYSAEFGAGRFDVTGTIEAYFASNALYQSVLDHGMGALSFKVGAAANKRYQFDVPALQFGNGERTQRRNDNDVMVSIPFRGVFDATTGGSLKITRAVS